MPPVSIVGVGIVPFKLAERRGARDSGRADWPELGRAAAQSALNDAGVPYSDVEHVVAGYCYGEPTCGQRVAYQLGLTGVPVLNVNNNCSTGSTALFVAKAFVEAGADCVLAVGFEKMKSSLSQVYEDAGWTNPTALHFERMYSEEMEPERVGADRAKSSERNNGFTDDVVKLFAYAAREHMARHGTTAEQFASPPAPPSDNA